MPTCMGKKRIFQHIDWEVGTPSYERTTSLSAAGSMLHGSFVGESVDLKVRGVKLRLCFVVTSQGLAVFGVVVS